MSSPSESGSMMSSRTKSGFTRRHSSSAPPPVCCPLAEKPSFSRLYFRSAKRSASSSMRRIFFRSEIRLHAAAQFERAASRLLPAGGEALFLQVVLQEREKIRVVLDEENFLHRSEERRVEKE